MKIRTAALLLLCLGLTGQAHADSRGGVWFYQPDGGSYHIDSRRSYQYDPRSPYPQHRQYPQNLPPRYQGQLPPQYYDRHRGLDRPQRWSHERRRDFDHPQRWSSGRQPGFNRWDREGRSERRHHRFPIVRDGRDYRMHQHRGFGDRHHR